MVTTKKAPPPPRVASSELPINREYQEKAKAELRAAIDAHGSSYEDLAKRLNAMGVGITARGLENKISRGGFSAAFMLQCVDALKTKN